ncbi:Probable cysteine protease rd19c, partial [Dionaea muscipula]
MREEDYPYARYRPRARKFDKNKIAASVANFDVVSPDEDQIAKKPCEKWPSC